MKYLGIILLFILADLFFAWFNINSWHWLQPFLMAIIFLYYITDNPWIYYSFAGIAGLWVDAYSATFGLHTVSFLLVLFILSSLQLTIFTSKNIGAIILLTAIGVFSFWLIVWLLHFILPWSVYTFYGDQWLRILRFYFIDVMAICVIYILYFNLKLKRHESR